MRRLPVALLSLLLLSGCTGDGDADLSEAEKAAATIDVEATDTTGVIRGVVVDTAIVPVAGVNVTIATLNITTTTTELGAFGFEDLEPGTYFLQTSKADYTSVQQSVDVVAGEQEPEAVRIQIQAIPRGTPFVETVQAIIFVSGAGWVDGVGGVTAGGFGVVDGNWNFGVAVSPNGTVAQTELVWDMTTALGETALAGGGTYTDDDNIDTQDWIGTSPLIMLANATEEDQTAVEVSYSFWGWPSAGTPVGMHINQKVDAFVNVFHNFRPDEGWTFTADGPHAVPP